MNMNNEPIQMSEEDIVEYLDDLHALPDDEILCGLGGSCIYQTLCTESGRCVGADDIPF